MAVVWKLEVQLVGDYKSLALAKSPEVYARLNDREGYGQAVLKDGAQGFWRMDAPSGTSESDQSGHSHTATYSTAFTLNQVGAIADGDKAATINRTGFLFLPSPISLVSSADIGTFEIWHKRDDAAAATTVDGYRAFFASSFASNIFPLIQKWNGSAWQLGAMSGTTFVASGATVPNDGLWHHYAAVYRSATLTDFYVDGVLIGTTNTGVALTAGSIDFIGCTSAGYAAGPIDEAAFYPTALTAVQMANHYALRLSTIASLASVTVADASGHAHTGTASGGVVFQQAALQPDGDKGALFDGASGYIDFGNVSALNFTGAFWASAWFQTTNGVNNFIVGKTLWSSGAGWALLVVFNKVRFWAYTSGGVQVFDVQTALNYNDGVKHHAFVAWDGTTNANGVAIYVDGVRAASATASANTPGNATDPFRIGAISGATPAYFTGWIDEVEAGAGLATAADALSRYLAGQWTDLSADRAHPNDMGMTLYGGIDGSGAPGDVMAAPGLWTFALDNSASNSVGRVGAYSPNSLNCRFGWTDGLRCRLGVTIGANPTFYKFPGWIEDIVPGAGLFNDQTVQVIVSDWLGQASSALAAGVAAQSLKRGDQLTASLVALVALPPYGTSYDVGPDTYLLALDDMDPASATVYQGLSNVAKSGLDRIYLKGDTVTGGVLRFESHSFRRTFITDAFALTDAAPGGQPGLAITDIQAARRRADRLNQIRFTVQPRKIDGSVVVLYSENIDPASAVAIPAAGGSITLWADYADPNQLAQSVAILDGSGVAPVATTDYVLNSSANGSGTNLTASCTVAVTFFSNTAKVVITNNHATLPAFRTLLQLRGKGIYSFQTMTLESINAARQGVFGQRMASESLPYQSSVLQAQAAADYYLALASSDAWTVVDAISVFVPVTDEATLWTLIQAETSTPFGATEGVLGFMNYPFWINKWQLDIDERDNVIFTFVPEPRDPNQYWSLGVAGLSELGLTTYMGPF